MHKFRAYGVDPMHAPHRRDGTSGSKGRSAIGVG
jgi:hypothetical protein